MVKTIVASFDGYHTAQKVVRQLIEDGFMSRDISIVASNVASDHAPGDVDQGTPSVGNTATGAVTGASSEAPPGWLQVYLDWPSRESARSLPRVRSWRR